MIFKIIISSLLCAAIFCTALHAQPILGYQTVSDARLQHPEPENWLMYRGSYQSSGFSALDQITTDNVKQLYPVWTFSTGAKEGHQSPPIVNDGTMFVTTPNNSVIALDAARGDVLWRYNVELPDDLFSLHPTNRGVALHGDLVYIATLDARLIALHAQSGDVVWQQTVEDYLNGYYMTLAPLVANGKVMVGVAGGEFGVRGFVQAFDAATGNSVWKTYTVPRPGEAGSSTWPGDTWKTGAVPVWLTGSFDPELNLTFWGTGNAGPWTAESRLGDNLYANSVIALDADTGALRGYHQYHWNDAWDWDETAAPILIDAEHDGRTFKGLLHAGRNGYLWLLEREPYQIKYIHAQPYVRQNVFSKLDPRSGRPSYDPDRIPRIGQRVEFCPSIWGGKDWPPSAYNPQTGYLYIPANENLCGALTGKQVEYEPGQLFVGVDIQDVELVPQLEAEQHIGQLQAWDIKKFKRVWTVRFKSHNWGPVLATAGGLVFSGGTNDRYFRAFDGATGEILWEQRTNSGVTGVPSSFAVDGVQYIAVQSGWGVDAQRKQDLLDKAFDSTTLVPQGGVIWVFALRQ